MRIDRLTLFGFRNIAELLLEPHSRFNVLCGNNGQGKTNLLEAIYFLGALQSFKGSQNRELIRWGQAEAVVRGLIAHRELSYDVAISLSPTTKRVKIDGKSPRSSFDYFGLVNVVVFGPDDLRITKAEPEARRRFLDRAIFNADPAYVKVVRDYQRVLKQRNAVLKAAQVGGSEELLEVYDGQLAGLGGAVILRRVQFLEAFHRYFSEVVRRVMGRAHMAELVYKNSVHGPEWVSAFEEQLRATRRRDVARGATSAGPHVDDLDVLLDGHLARTFASQGQHRALVLALKIGEIAFLRAVLGFYPILLLDDVSSELDHERNRQLMAFLQAESGQVYITTTDTAHLGLSGDYRVFRVVDGRVELA